MLTESYLQYIQNDNKENLQEFVILPIIVLLVRSYTRHLSKAAQSCVGHTRTSKTICILEYKLRATQQIQRDLEKLRSKCSKDNNPEKCIIRLSKKIAQYKIKEEKLRQQISKEYQKV